jgi:hypothetical protein
VRTSSREITARLPRLRALHSNSMARTARRSRRNGAYSRTDRKARRSCR